MREAAQVSKEMAAEGRGTEQEGSAHASMRRGQRTEDPHGVFPTLTPPEHRDNVPPGHPWISRIKVLLDVTHFLSVQ